MPNKKALKSDKSESFLTIQQANKPKTGRYIRVFVFLVAGLAILWYIGRGQDVDAIFREFRNANYAWIVLALIAALMSHIVRALRWNILIRSLGGQSSQMQTFNALMTGYLANLVVPRLGEITRCVVHNRTTRTPLNALIGTVVSERVFDMLTLGTIIFLTIAFQFDFLKGFMNSVFFEPLLARDVKIWTSMLVVGVLLAGAGLSLFLVIRKKMASSEQGSFFHKLKHQYVGLKNGLLTIWTMKKKGTFLLYSLLIWGLYFANVYLCLLAIESLAHLSPLSGLTLLAIGSLGIVAPVPGGIGTYHFLTIKTLTELYGIAAEPAISYAYIAHATQTLIIIISGAVAWITLSSHKK